MKNYNVEEMFLALNGKFNSLEKGYKDELYNNDFKIMNLLKNKELGDKIYDNLKISTVTDKSNNDKFCIYDILFHDMIVWRNQYIHSEIKNSASIRFIKNKDIFDFHTFFRMISAQVDNKKIQYLKDPNGFYYTNKDTEIEYIFKLMDLCEGGEFTFNSYTELINIPLLFADKKISFIDKHFVINSNNDKRIIKSCVEIILDNSDSLLLMTTNDELKEFDKIFIHREPNEKDNFIKINNLKIDDVNSLIGSDHELHISLSNYGEKDCVICFYNEKH